MADYLDGPSGNFVEDTVIAARDSWSRCVQRGGTLRIINIAAKQAVENEVIMDRGMDGGEFLQGHYVPEICHRTFSSSKPLM